LPRSALASRDASAEREPSCRHGHRPHFTARFFSTPSTGFGPRSRLSAHKMASLTMPLKFAGSG